VVVHKSGKSTGARGLINARRIGTPAVTLTADHQMTGFAPARSVNSAMMAFFVIEEAMKRDQMLMEAILGQLLQSPEPQIGSSSIAQRLNVERPVVRHHLNLLQDRGLVQESENGVWRLTNQGHDYMEGTPEQGISLNLSSK
jgi:predicted transcriptional regulator